ALILGSIGLFLFSGINHLFLKLVGAKNSYEATFRVFAYLSVFNILVAVSNVNNPAAKAIGFIISLYVLYVMIVALKEVHEISFLRSAIAVLLPIVIMIIIVVIIVAILVTLVFMGSMGGIAQTDPYLLPMQAKAIVGY
ncbi:MAG: YIP1 family protein, partial [archaeon]|nr:YIP1 family protein [archaeon]